MVSVDEGLEAIMFGDIAPEDARKVVMQMLEEQRDGLEIGRLCDALKSFVWGALNQQRRDEELKGWYDLFRFLANVFTWADVRTYGARFEAMAELLWLSISAEDMPADAMTF